MSDSNLSQNSLLNEGFYMYSTHIDPSTSTHNSPQNESQLGILSSISKSIGNFFAFSNRLWPRNSLGFETYLIIFLHKKTKAFKPTY